MSISVGWHDVDQTIVRYDFSGVWNWDEVYGAVETAIEMEESVTYRVDVILNLLDSAHVPPNAITHVKNIATTKMPDNLKMAVLVTENRAMQVLFNIGSRLYRKIEEKFYVATSLETALNVITQSRAREDA